MKYRPLTIYTLLAFSLLLSVGCASTPQTDDPLATALTNSKSRSAEDKARDAGRRPAEVIAYLGIEAGMKVLDVIAAGGYYTEVLSHAVGPTGTVYAQNPARVLKFRDGANDKAMTARLANDRLPNVTRLDRELGDLGIEPNSLDAAVTALNLHDVYNESPAAALGMLRSIKDLLKHGGVLGVIDHEGNFGADNKSLHRMRMLDAMALGTNAGFTVQYSPLLVNHYDEHTESVFSPTIRGKTDRFILKMTKP